MTSLGVFLTVMGLWVAMSFVCALILGSTIRFGMGDRDDC